MIVTEVPVKKLKSFEQNAKLHTEEQIQHIMRSIIEFGFTQPVVVDEEYTILVGHGRTEAAKRLGMKKVPTRQIENLTVSEKAALNLADNKIQHETGFNEKSLELIMGELKAADFPAPEFGLMFKEQRTGETFGVKNPVDVDNSSIKQVIFQMTSEQLEQVLGGFEKLMESNPALENHTQVFLWLLEQHELR